MTHNKGNSILRRVEVRKIIEGRRGETASLARQLQVSHNAVRFVLTGKTDSARILEAATKRAEQILAETETVPRDEPAACA